MSKKINGLFAISKKIVQKSKNFSANTQSEHADKNIPREGVIRKSYALTKNDIENIQLIKEKCLNKRIVLSESHIIRIAINLTANLSEEVIIKAIDKIPKILMGRPKLK